MVQLQHMEVENVVMSRCNVKALEYVNAASWCFKMSDYSHDDWVDYFNDEGDKCLESAWKQIDREFARGGR